MKLSELNLNVNWAEVTTNSFEPLPDGDYAGQITDSIIQATKSGNGFYIKLTITLMGAAGVKGRMLYDYVNIKNSNEIAQKIGQGVYKTLCGVLELDPDTIGETSELHGIPLGVRLVTESREKDGTLYENNKIKQYLNFDEELLDSSTNEEISF